MQQIKDTTDTIIQSASRFFAGTMFSRAAGLGRDIAMAYAFGTNESVAAFFVAYRFSHLLRRLLGEGALQSAFIPAFEKLRNKDSKRAGQFFYDLICSLTGLLIAIVGLSLFILPFVNEVFDLSASNSEIIDLTARMMPGLIFICLFGVFASLLQCNQNYFIPSFAPVSFNVIWIIGSLIIMQAKPEDPMHSLSIAVVIACLSQWLMTLPASIRTLKEMGGIKRKWPNFFSADVRSLLKPLALGTLGVGATQINSALDSIFARWADAEGPAYLWYALRLQQLPLALFGVAISGAVLPPLCRAAKNSDLAKFQEFIHTASRKLLDLMIPITFGIFLLGKPAIEFLYGRGNFGQSSVAGTLPCLYGYGLGLIPMAMVLILAPALYAKGDYKTPARGSILAMAANILLNGLIIGCYNIGASGIALATSASACLNLLVLTNRLAKEGIGILPRNSLIFIGKYLAANFAAYCIASRLPSMNSALLELMMGGMAFSVIVFSLWFFERHAVKKAKQASGLN